MKPKATHSRGKESARASKETTEATEGCCGAGCCSGMEEKEAGCSCC